MTDVDIYNQAHAHASSAGVEANEAYSQILALPVQTKEDIVFVTSILQQIKSKIKELEETRKWVTKPITESLERVRSLFRPPLERLNECEDILKSKIVDAHARVREEQQALLAQASQGNVEEHLANAQAADIGKVKGLQMRESWTYRVVDLKLIPEEYWKRIVDHEKILAIVKEKKETTNIPGIEPYADVTVAVRQPGG